MPKPSAPSFDVVAVGHVLVDIRFLVERHPAPDEEAEILQESRGVGGSAANVSIAVVRLGGRSAIIAKLGLDAFARIAAEEIMREGVDVSPLRVSLTSPTGFSIVVRDREGRIILYGFKGAAEELGPYEVSEEAISRARFVHIASLRLDSSIRAAELAKKHGALVSWDPGRVLARKGLSSLSEIISKVDIVFVNSHEARYLTGIEDYREAARRIREAGPDTVIVKLGPKGAYMLSSEGEAFQEAIPVEPVDTTGAGDTFAAGFLVALSKGWDRREALRYAAVAAAMKVTRLGSHAAPTRSEIDEFCRRRGLKPFPPV